MDSFFWGGTWDLYTADHGDLRYVQQNCSACCFATHVYIYGNRSSDLTAPPNIPPVVVGWPKIISLGLKPRIAIVFKKAKATYHPNSLDGKNENYIMGALSQRPW